MGFFVALRRPTTWMSPPFTSMVIFTYVTSRDIHPREFEEKTGDKPKQKAYQLDIIEYMYNACVYVYCSKLYTDSIGDIIIVILKVSVWLKRSKKRFLAGESTSWTSIFIIFQQTITTQ